MDPTMYIFLNAGAGMSAGKAAAQAAHAAVEGYRLSCPPAPDRPEQSGYFMQTGLVNRWYRGGHYKKIVLRADNEQHLVTIRFYLEARGFKTSLIVDEGMTEVRPHTATALGVEVVDKDHPHVAATFSTFSLYREEPKVVILERTGIMNRDDLAAARKLISEDRMDEARLLVQRSAPTKPGPLTRFIDWLGRPSKTPQAVMDRPARRPSTEPPIGKPPEAQ